VAQVVEAQRRPTVFVQVSGLGGAPEHPLGDVPLPVRGTTASREDPIG
jgi:hypothetical protein